MKEEILKLKSEMNAVILAHHYQSMAVKEVADFVGDSLELSKIASTLEQPVVVLCGVHFMAETVKMLSPEKKVYLPNRDAGCPMADMVTSERLMALKELHPDAAVVTYVNSSAEVKAISDICCTSSNAVKIVRSMKEKKIIFVPDQNLGQYVQSQCPDKEIILWKGFCPTHHRVTHVTIPEGAVFFAHPECRPEILKEADFIGSTGQIIEACKKTSANQILIGTEMGVVDSLRVALPDKTFYALDTMICPNMKKTTLEDIRNTLLGLNEEIVVPQEIAEKAKGAIEKMIERS
mgnify:CR=1 FL=1